MKPTSSSDDKAEMQRFGARTRMHRNLNDRGYIRFAACDAPAAGSDAITMSSMRTPHGRARPAR